MKSNILPIITLAVSSLFYTCFSHATEVVSVPDEHFHRCLNGYLQQPIPLAPITDTQLASLTGQLSCAETGTVDITGAEYLVNIDYFNIEYNQLTTLSPISNLTKLTRLAAGGNHITTGEPLKGLVNLQNLDLNNNSLSDGNFISSLGQLVSLDLSTNNIRTCPGIENLKNLKNLYLQGSRMIDISNFAPLTQLEQLSLSDNGISDISALSVMASLISLDLQRQDVQINPVPNSGTVTIVDPVINVDGSPIPPTSISDGGIYQQGQIIWTNIPLGADSVSLDFSQQIQIDGLTVQFDGSVTQYLE